MTRLRLLAAACLLAMGAPALADDGFLAGLHKNTLVGSTVPKNGDQNPYALIVAPVSSGAIHKDDVLVGNFNNGGNLQGVGTTIVDFPAGAKTMTTFATIPQTLAGCPGGVGLSTALVMLRSGWTIVGSAPSTDGTTKTLGAGCLIVLDNQGKVAGTIAGPEIADPWGNMAWIDNGDTATLFLSNAGAGIGAPGQPVQHRANVVRLDLKIPSGQAPQVVSKTVIADGLPSQADASVFLIGPTGLTLGHDGTLYASDAIGNRIVAIADAATRNDAAPLKEVTKDGMLHRPLAMVTAPNGNLLAVNGLDGYVVEIDPKTGRQVGRRLIDGDEAQTPPGSGDLFGIAMNPAGDGFYYVEDDVNTLDQAK